MLPKLKQYENPNERLQKSIKNSYESQRFKNTQSKIISAQGSSEVPAQNSQFKVPKVILQTIGHNSRQQHQQNMLNSNDKMQNAYKSGKDILNSSVKKSEDKNKQGQNEKKFEPQSQIQRSIVSKMRLPNIGLILSSRGKEKCPICLVQNKKKQLISICDGQCSHLFCRSCMHQYVIFKIKMFEKVACPDQNCQATMKLNSQIYAQLPLQIKEKFKKILQYNEILLTKTKRVCPNQNCSGLLEISDPSYPVRCQQCNIVYCSKCFFHDHEGECDSYQLKFFTQTLNYRQCLNCLNIIQKTEGCNHMTCRCGYQFCYLCGNKWTNLDNCQILEGAHFQPYQEQNCCFCCNFDFLLSCSCFDECSICEVRPIRWISKLLVIVVFLAVGVPFWLLYLIVQILINIVMGLVLGLLLYPLMLLFDQSRDNCKWIILGIVFLPIGILILIFLGLRDTFIERMCDIEEIYFPCSAINSIAQL